MMKIENLFLLLLISLLVGCAYNSQTITADNGAKVDCRGSVDKPVSVSTPVTAKDNEVPLPL